MNRVLIITYYWPPGSGAGVQRWLKFSKYLPEFGWQPVILTVDPQYAAYPALDPSLENEIPAGIKVYRTKATDWFRFYSKDKSKVPSAGFATNANNTLMGKISRFIRGNFFIPDPRKGWNKFALDKAVEIILKEGISHVITSSPPHSTQLLGLEIKQIFPGVKWIADLRDPWTDIYYYNQFYPTFISRMIDRKYEKKVLKFSDSIITVGDNLKESFQSKTKGISEKIEVITNGYDEQDFRDAKEVSPGKFIISYIGTLSDSYPVEGFLKALGKLGKNGNEYILRLVGSMSSSQRKKILEATGNERFEFIPHVNHQRAIDHMISSSVLLLIIPDHSGNKCILTGKLFEYLASQKPIICIGPADGDAAKIIEKTGHGATFGYSDSDGITGYLSGLISGKSNGSMASIEDFSRRELTRKIIPLLNK